MWKPLDPDVIGHGQRCDTFTVETAQHLDRGYEPLQCDNCAATWVGPIREPCPWCDETIEVARRWRAEEILRPPDIDRDDIRWPAVKDAWQQRLAAAITAELITQQQAADAWDRA